MYLSSLFTLIVKEWPPFAESAVATFVILKVIDAICGLRVDEEAEVQGLDLALHEERGYDL